MGLPLLATGMIVALLLAYAAYGRLVAAQYRLDDHTVTPAVALRDGVDYEPAPPFYLCMTSAPSLPASATRDVRSPRS
jgi:carbon starvation protein CstA